jgi:hypothetical protein
VLAGIALLAIAGAVVIGRATAEPSSRHHDVSVPVASKAGLHAPHGPTRMHGALPVGFTDDEAGALSAASIAGETLIDYVQVRRTTSSKTWIATYTTGDLGVASLQKILDWDPRLYRLTSTEEPKTLAPRRQAIGVTEVVPVGYKILSFTPSAAHLQVWFHGAGWSEGSRFPNVVIDHSADVQLVWRSADWKITGYTQPADQPWPGPALDDASANGFVPWPGGQFTFVTG